VRKGLDFLFLSAPQVFETPCLITMIIAATRMHRNLIDFASKPPRLVGNFFAFLFCPRSWDRYHSREYQNLQVSDLVFARTKQTDTTPTTLNRIEVTVPTAFERHPTAQKSGNYSSDMTTNEKRSPTGPTSDDDSSTIISPSEHMSHIGDSSKLDPSQAFTHPLPTVSPSPQAQNV
jgi:hypothetical protein